MARHVAGTGCIDNGSGVMVVVPHHWMPRMLSGRSSVLEVVAGGWFTHTIQFDTWC